jgi:hypothetical protein
MRHLLQRFYTAAGSKDAHTHGSSTSRELQDILKRIMVSPRFVPRKLKPVSQSGSNSPDDAIRMALKLVDKGQVGKAAHILNSQGLAVVNESTMAQLLALFPGATMSRTAAADLPEQMSGLPVAFDEDAQSLAPSAIASSATDALGATQEGADDDMSSDASPARPAQRQRSSSWQ